MYKERNESKAKDFLKYGFLNMNFESELIDSFQEKQSESSDCH